MTARPEPRVHTIDTTTHGRYLVAAPAAAGPHPLLVGFHGYGENAATHLEALQRIPGLERWVVVAVEALHLFYTRRREVVASWMTRVGREQAIEDNLAYVDRVMAAVRRDTPVGEGVVFAGFSQGVAMAYRAALRSGAACRGLLVLGSDLPPDVAAIPDPLPPILLGRGREDGWYTAEKHEADLRALAGRAAVEVCLLDAGHEWTDAFAVAAGAFLERITAAQPGASSSRAGPPAT